MSTAVPTLPPPLRDGDRLSREDFLRRWEAMPNLKRAELIDGVVYMPSPLGLNHGEFHIAMGAWIGHYMAKTPGCRAAADATWLMGPDDVPQPDVALRILPEHGGQSRKEGIYAAGAPELIVEVSFSSRARDLGPKLQLYQRAGVAEYITVLLREKEIVWRELVKGRYRKIAGGEDGVLRSHLFPGLWLDVAAVWRIDLARMFAVLDQGAATPEHAEFVRRLGSHNPAS